MNRSLQGAVAAYCLAALGCQSIPDGERQKAGAAALPPPAAATPAVTVADAPAPEALLDLPLRRADAEGGRAFLRRLAALPVAVRERAIVDEILRGNVPSHLRTLAKIRLGTVLRGDRAVPVTAWVMRDYLAVGSDDDFVHVPLGYDAVMRLCAATGMALPTRKIVEAVYSRATLRLTPRPLPASRMMTSVAYVLRHDDEIDLELRAKMPVRAFMSSALIAGHKKDVVATKRLVHRPDRIAIFGWHRLEGPGAMPLQPLSLAHDRNYADYSHGIRLVAGMLEIGGAETPLAAAMASTELAALVSDEGTFPSFAAVAGLETHRLAALSPSR